MGKRIWSYQVNDFPDPFEEDKDVKYSIERAGYHIKQSIKDNLTKDQLIDIDTKLSGYYSFLQTRAAAYQLEMNTDYWFRHIEYSKHAIKERATKLAQNKLDHLAKIEVEAEIKQQNFSAYQFEYLHRFLLGVAKVINSVKNRLRWMEIEYQQQKGQT